MACVFSYVLIITHNYISAKQHTVQSQVLGIPKDFVYVSLMYS